MMTPKGKRYKREYARELLKIAKGDLGSARDLLSGKKGRPENICYLTQQSVEKCLKAALCALGLPIVHTHDIEALVNSLPDENRPPEAHQLPALTEYATVRRYEEGYQILTSQELKQVVASGAKVVHWAEKLIDRYRP